MQKKNRKIQAVLFDMDGLMFDTERLYINAWIQTGKLLKIPIDNQFLIPSRGMIRADSRKLFEELYDPKMKYDEIIGIRQEFVEKELDKGVACKKGLFELLNYLKEQEYKIALATSTPKERAIRILNQTNTIDYFNKLVFGDMVERGKPEPDIFIKAAEEVETSTEHCLVLEDSANGIRSGKRAGCTVIMIPDLVPATEEIKQLLDEQLEDLKQVISWLKMINQES